MGVSVVRAGGVIAVVGLLGCAPLNEGAGEGDTDGSSGPGTNATMPTTTGPLPTTTSQSGTGTGDSDPTVDPPDTDPTTAGSDSEGSTSPVDPDTGSTTASTTDDSVGSEDSTSSGEVIPEDRRVFLSSETYDGNLGGVDGADDACQDLADAAKLGGQWRAYIIEPGNDLSRHTQDDRAFVRLDGVQVADDWDDLTDGSIQATIDLDENEQPRSGNAWTGFYDVVGADDNWCDGWTFGGGNCLNTGVCGSAGESNMTDTHWDGFYIFNCSDEYRLYCVEQ